MITQLLPKLLAGESLSREESVQAADAIMTGEATSVQIAGFLVALRMKGETADEVAGFVESMRSHGVSIQLKNSNAVDGVGTGGDGAGSFNISTAAGIAAAAAGVTVAKHGNRSVSSKCGSADLLEATGGNIDPGPETVKKCIDEIGFGFMFAPRFHPAMKYALPPRRELAVRTIFNILGPMTNPAGVRGQLIGVYDRALMPLMARVLLMTGSKRVMIVHSQDGLDEISISAPTDFFELHDGNIREGVITPDDCSLRTHAVGAVTGGDAVENLKILQAVLAGEKSAYRDVVILNAAAMVRISGQADSMADSAKLVSEAIDTGRAKDLLANWVEVSRQ